MSLFLVCIFCLFTAVISSAIGVGGGAVLLPLLSFFYPATAIIPLHGMTQFISNLSRATLTWQDIAWRIIRLFIVGSIVGGILGCVVRIKLNESYLFIILGSAIIIQGYLSKKLSGGFLVTGIIQGFLGLYIGVVGSFSTARLMKEDLELKTIIATNAVMSGFVHLIKIFVFLYWGFSFLSYWNDLLWMSLSMVLGTYLGTKLSGRIPEKAGKKVLGNILILLAILMILKGLRGLI